MPPGAASANNSFKKNWPTGWASRLPSVTIRPARRSGIRSHIGYSAKSAKPGLAVRYGPLTWWLDYIIDTETQTGLTVKAHLVTTPYPTGVKVSDAIMETLNIQAHDRCPQWNYTIQPRPGSLS